MAVTVPLVALAGAGFPPPLVLLQPIVAVGLAANLFHFLGPAVEYASTRLRGDAVLPVGPALRRMGLTFSVGVVFLPLMMAILTWTARVVGLVV